ncbi:MAG: hypothetical protein AAGC71_01115 [Pseudomonadota bacterium]
MQYTIENQKTPPENTRSNEIGSGFGVAANEGVVGPSRPDGDGVVGRRC